MSSISGIGTDYYSQISSGQKIQKAADGPAELGIIEQKNTQINGYDVGTRNAEDAQNLLNVADSALGDITDNLQRMRELAVQASNTAVLSDGDRQMIQDEIDQLKQGISDIANNTEFNTKKLLDGSNDNMHVASGPDGEGPEINTGDATLQALGIADFDVTGNFDIQTIDNAIGALNSTRSGIGAQSNALDYNIAYNSMASLNLTKSVSNMQDTDIAEATSEMKKQQLLQNYQLMMQKKKQEQETNKLSIFQM